MSDLLGRIGIDADCQPLFDTCAKFNLEENNKGEWLFRVVDQQLTLDCKEVWLYRPLQLDVVKDDITGKTTISSTGKGWDKSHINWFDKTIEPEKMKNKPPTNCMRHKKASTSTRPYRLSGLNSIMTLGGYMSCVVMLQI